MKKSIFVVVVIAASASAFAQKKMKPPPPPPPPSPIENLKEIPPPPPKPKKPPIIKDEVEQVPATVNKEYQVFLKRNPTVKEIVWNKNRVRIHFKSGKEEVFDMNNKEDVEKLKNAYGELPAAPPPPPPPTPKKPKLITES